MALKELGLKKKIDMHNWHNPIVAPGAAAVNTNVAEISAETPLEHWKTKIV